MKFDTWVKNNLGKAIDYDSAYGVQCVDLAKHYIKNVLGINPKSIGNAIEYYNKRNSEKYLKDNFVWVDNTPDFVPQKGDLGVFKSKSGNGHICVCTGQGGKTYFYSYDQNYPKALHEPMTKIKHTYTSFLGVLRPKNQENIGAKATIKYYKKYNGNSKSLVDAMNSLGIDSDFRNRTIIAKNNGVKDYVGAPIQNIRLLSFLKRGELIKK